MNTHNRVWIELDLPQPGHPEQGHARAEAATRMLNKLGVTRGEYSVVWFDESKWRYAFCLDSAGTFVLADDHGQWFNLDKLAS
jgi:hypothetical protein